jgi:hypothetical protein
MKKGNHSKKKKIYIPARKRRLFQLENIPIRKRISFQLEKEKYSN